MANHYEPLKSLCPVNWEDVPRDDLKTFLDSVFSEAQTVVDSIPSTAQLTIPDESSAPSTGRARAKTDSAVLRASNSARPATTCPRQRTSESVTQAQSLKKEWKEAKVNPRDNPLGVQVYKLGAKDGKGAWFARRSVHEGLSFDQWKQGLQREFVETMKSQGRPGSGSIRGIGADRRVEIHDVPGAGEVQVFQLSAQFPGPTSPRDFITLLLSSDTPQPVRDDAQPLRQFVVVSRPCVHPECPPRSGIIRGQYESVEVIRELPVENLASKRSWSSADLNSANEPISAARSRESVSSDKGQGSETVTTIEWLMVTRSDPGGSVPRFMIEKGTPPGIVNDAGKFLNWLTSKPPGEPPSSVAGEADVSKAPAETDAVGNGSLRPDNESALHRQTALVQGHAEGGDDVYWSNGLFGMITGAFEAAGSVVATGLRKQFSGVKEDGSESLTDSLHLRESDDPSSPSETSSIRSFTSALEKSMTEHKDDPDSIHESQSDDRSQDAVPQIKELKRLQERRRKLDEKAAKMAQSLESKRQGDKERDAAALAKAREKHEKEIAKHEAKYKRELRRLEEKREQEERKAMERRKKAIEREEKSNLALELDRARAERDIALKKAELLKTQVGELQAQNTMLVARLGKLNTLDKTDSASMSSTEIRRQDRSQGEGGNSIP